MNAQDYISSGLLEGYILGALPPGEMEQVAGAMCRFSEVRTEVGLLEEMLLARANEDFLTPPPELEDKIWAAIQATSPVQRNEESSHVVTPVVAPTAGAKIIPLGRPEGRRIAWPLAASLALLIGSLIANFIFWDNHQNDRQEVASLQTQASDMNNKLQTISAQHQALAASLTRYQKEAEMMAQPGMQTVPMQTTQKNTPMAATMYWDRAKGEAYVSVQKLPPPPAGMQYQLWAIAAGKPVDIGMLDNETVLNSGMQRVPKSVLESQAFAISLEKAGGSPLPTAERIYVLGKMPAA